MDLDPPSEQPANSNGMTILSRRTLSPGPVASPHPNGELIEDEAPKTTPGISVAIQVDKVGDVGAETARVLDVGTASVLHANWHPHDPSLLLTAGTDALCRIWKISRNASSRDINGHGQEENGHGPQTPFVELNVDGSDSTYITALQWNPDGDIIAIAPREFDQEGNGTVAILSKANGYIDVVPVGSDPLVCLRWTPRGSHLLGVSSSMESQNSDIFIWNVASGGQLDVLTVDGIVIDAVWISDDAFALCVGPCINQYRISNQRAIPFASASSPSGTSEGDAFQVMRWDKFSRTIAVGSENGDVHVSTFLSEKRIIAKNGRSSEDRTLFIDSHSSRPSPTWPGIAIKPRLSPWMISAVSPLGLNLGRSEWSTALRPTRPSSHSFHRRTLLSKRSISHLTATHLAPKPATRYMFGT